MSMVQLQKGDFVRVKSDSEFRPGQDGMVVEPSDGHSVGLIAMGKAHPALAS